MKLTRQRRARPRSLDEALLPLVNIVFLLMVFFLASGRFAVTQPAAGAPRSAQAGTPTAAPRVLQLHEDGSLSLQAQRFSEAELPRRALDWQGAPLDVRAAAGLPAQRVLHLLAVLRDAGVSEVRLLTVKAPG